VTSPNTTLRGTTIATMVRESDSAEIAAGVVIDWTNAVMPASNVRNRIIPSGISTSAPR
jgi:hypothetical protein